VSTWDVAVLGGAVVERDDARATPWRDVRLDKLASPSARMLVAATTSALGGRVLDHADRVGVYVASGETGLDVTAFLPAAHVAWDEHPDDPDYARMGGRALRAIDPYYSLRSLANGPGSLLAMQLEATGPSLNLAHEAAGGAWALVAALDDLSARRCDVAVVGACDLPGIPTRRAIARQRQGRLPGDRAAVVVIGRADRLDTATVSLTVRWDATAATFEANACEPDVVAPLESVVRAGLASGWRSACEARMPTPTGRVLLTVVPVVR